MEARIVLMPEMKCSRKYRQRIICRKNSRLVQRVMLKQSYRLKLYRKIQLKR